MASVIMMTFVKWLSNYSILGDLSSEYGVSEVTIYAWIKKFTPMGLQSKKNWVLVL